MRIIIEGCDKSGKSTLIEALKNEIPSLIGLKLLTKPKDKSEASQTYIKQMYIHMADMTRDQKAHYLFDRYYPSQMVYSFKRDHDDMKDLWFASFEKELRKTPNLYVLLNVDRKLLLERFKKDGEDYAKPEEIDRIQKRYLKQFKNSTLNKMMVDPTDNLPATVQKIKDAMAEILNPKTVDFTDMVFESLMPGQSDAHKAAAARGDAAREEANK